MVLAFARNSLIAYPICLILLGTAHKKIDNKMQLFGCVERCERWRRRFVTVAFSPQFKSLFCIEFRTRRSRSRSHGRSHSHSRTQLVSRVLAPSTPRH